MNEKHWFFQRESSSCFDMLTLSGTLHYYNDLNMTEGMRARAHSQFYGRKTSYETIFYLPEILGQFRDSSCLFHVAFLRKGFLQLVY